MKNDLPWTDEELMWLGHSPAPSDTLSETVAKKLWRYKEDDGETVRSPWHKSRIYRKPNEQSELR